MKKASEYATANSSGNNTMRNSRGFERRSQFKLEITEKMPTRDQLRCILDYIQRVPLFKANVIDGRERYVEEVTPVIGAVVKGAKNEFDAFLRMKANPDNFHRPMVVDWSRGRASSVTNELVLMDMIGL